MVHSMSVRSLGVTRKSRKSASSSHGIRRSSLDTTPTIGDRATLFATPSPDPASMFDGDTKLMPYVDWVAARIRALGGVATSASLGSTLAVESAENYNMIKVHFGGLCGLLSRYPERFRLLHDKPLNHVAVVGPAAVSSSDDDIPSVEPRWLRQQRRAAAGKGLSSSQDT